MLQESLGDLRVCRVLAHGEVSGQHHRRVANVRVVGIRYGRDCSGVLGRVLPLAGRALDQFPFVAIEVLEKAMVPGRRIVGPGAFDTAGDRVRGHARAVTAVPADPLVLDAGTLWICSDVSFRASAVRFAERVSANNQRDRLFIVHRHAHEGAADVLGGPGRVGLATGTFGVDVDQAHVVGAELLVEHAVAVMSFVSQPLLLNAPVSFVCFPRVWTAKSKAERLEAHRFKCAVAREDQEIGPGQLLAVLLLDRPEQASRLVKVGVVGPTVERGEALLSDAAAAATVADSVGAGRVPGHANEERTIVTVVRRPPVLRGGHHRFDVSFQRLNIKRSDRSCIVESCAHRI